MCLASQSMHFGAAKYSRLVGGFSAWYDELSRPIGFAEFYRFPACDGPGWFVMYWPSVDFVGAFCGAGEMIKVFRSICSAYFVGYLLVIAFGLRVNVWGLAVVFSRRHIRVLKCYKTSRNSARKFSRFVYFHSYMK